MNNSGTMRQKRQTYAKTEYANPITLIGIPKRPKLHRALGKVSGCQSRRCKTQPTEIEYDNMSATVLRDAIALKAAVDPRLMRERSTVRRQDSVTALAGIWSLGWTWRVLIKMTYKDIIVLDPVSAFHHQGASLRKIPVERALE